MEENKKEEIYELEETTENYDVKEVDNDESGLGTGGAMILGGGIVLGVLGATHLIKKAIAKRRSKKEDLDEDDNIIDGECTEVDEEEDKKTSQEKPKRNKK